MRTLEELGVSPAPWHCWHNRDGGMDVVDGDSNAVAKILSDDAHDWSDGDLVSAAPDLYAALRMCLAFIDDVANEDPRLLAVKKSDAVYAAHAALEKAGGAE